MRPLFALLFAFACTATTRAWDAAGHEIISAIAYAHLNPKAKQAVAQLVTQVHSSRGVYDATTIGCWMDDIRDDPAVPDEHKLRSWHYIDIPIDPGQPMPPFDPGSDTDLHGNAVQALKRAVIVLKGGTDPYIKDPPTALAIVEHLVGDLHQPLHCATNLIVVHGNKIDDRGGNLEIVSNGPPGLQKFTLHRFWDDAYRASFDEATGCVRLEDAQVSPSQITECEDDLHKQGSAISLEPDFDTWAKAGNSVARHLVYPGLASGDDPKLCRLSSAYVAQARLLARAQLDAAGLRLATLLNETLGGEAPPPSPPNP